MRRTGLLLVLLAVFSLLVAGCAGIGLADTPLLEGTNVLQEQGEKGATDELPVADSEISLEVESEPEGFLSFLPVVADGSGLSGSDEPDPDETSLEVPELPSDPRLNLLGNVAAIDLFTVDTANIPSFRVNEVEEFILVGYGGSGSSGNGQAYTGQFGPRTAMTLDLNNIPNLPVDVQILNPCESGKFIPTQSFRWSPDMSWKTSGYHPGYDFVCQDGDTLVASVDSVVYRVYPNLALSDRDSITFWGSGHLVILASNINGVTYLFVYAHLAPSSPGEFPQVGEFVRAGQPIGIMGNTGKVVSSSGGDGTHLHYGIAYLDSAGNPSWLDPQQIMSIGRLGNLAIAPSPGASVVAGARSNAPTVSNNASCGGRTVLDNVALAQELARQEGVPQDILLALWYQETHFIDRQWLNGQCVLRHNTEGAFCMAQIYRPRDNWFGQAVVHGDVSVADLEDINTCLAKGIAVLKGRKENTWLEKAAGYQGMYSNGRLGVDDPAFINGVVKWLGIGGFNVLMEDGSTVWVSFTGE